MPLIAGIDIGNATTEVALASDDPQARAFVASGIVATTLSIAVSTLSAFLASTFFSLSRNAMRPTLL